MINYCMLIVLQIVLTGLDNQFVAVRQTTPLGFFCVPYSINIAFIFSSLFVLGQPCLSVLCLATWTQPYGYINITLVAVPQRKT